MIDKILVPLDGSVLAQCVLPHVLTMARAYDSEVTFLHVLQQASESDEQHVDPLDWHLRKAEARAYLQQISQTWADAGVSAAPVLVEGPAAERIIEFANQDHTDLIVLSSHGRSGLSEWNISSVVQKVIFRAGRSVMIIRAYQTNDAWTTAEPAIYDRILVPLDGSRRAEGVLPFASRLAARHDAELLRSHVVPQPYMFLRQPATTEDNRLINRFIERNRDEASRYLETIQNRLNVPGRVRLLIADNVASSLQALAEEEEVSLVLLSAHGHAGSKRPYGSVVTSFIAYGATPLLIVQDLPQEEIQPTQAEIAARAGIQSGSPRMIAYAPPSF